MDEFAGALRRLLDDPALAARNGTARRESVIEKMFTVERMVEATVRAYQEVLSDARNRRWHFWPGC